VRVSHLNCHWHSCCPVVGVHVSIDGNVGDASLALLTVDAQQLFNRLLGPTV